jgi:tetratricopeptide (TPR) repeat protein
MPSKAPPSAASPVALQTAAAATPVRFAPDVLGDAGSRDALARLNEAMGELKALAIQPMLQRAVDALKAEDFLTAQTWAIKALERDERNGFGWYLLAIARERAGDFASSVQSYEMALRLIPDHAEVANDLGRLAFRMGMRPQAEKLFRHFLAANPDNPEGANNLSSALRDQGRYEEAIEVLRPAILANPEFAALWNAMGTVVGEQGDFPNAQLFFEESLRLDPAAAKTHHNLSNSRLALGDAQGALEACDKALALVTAADERQMMRLARSTILMSLGRTGEGWDEYEARLHPQFREVTHFVAGRPRWEPGADLAGKTLLVLGEQGLGDEVLFGGCLPEVIEALGPDGKLLLGVEHRLVPLFQRAFPQAEVGAHATKAWQGRPARYAPFAQERSDIDLWSPLASLLRQYRRTLDQFPERDRYLTADPERVAYWRAQVQAAGPGPKVGLLWKSAINKDARHRHFSPFETWAPVLAQPGAAFVNLQYGDCDAELALARERFGFDIWQPPGIDLKQDLDDVAALCCAMDLVVGFSNATLNLGAACGAPTWLISTHGSWGRMGLTDRYPWYPQARMFMPPSFGAWEAVMGEVGTELGRWLSRAPTER